MEFPKDIDDLEKMSKVAMRREMEAIMDTEVIDFIRRNQANQFMY